VGSKVSSQGFGTCGEVSAMNSTLRRPPPTGSGPSINLTPEQFRQLMIAALEDSPRAREIVRQAFLPAFPVQGAAPSPNYIPVWDANSILIPSVMYQSGSRIGVGTTAPSFPFDLNGNVFAIGPKQAQPGAGGTMRFRDDTSLVRWSFGIPGTAAAKDFFIYDNVNGHGPLYIQAGAASYSLYMSDSGNVGILTDSPSFPLDVNGNALGVGPKTSSSGNGGTVKFRDDTAAEHWLLGLPSSGGGTSFRITDLANSHDVVSIDSGTPASTLALKSSGNVGIGTTSPAAKLDVAGGINASGAVGIRVTSPSYFLDVKAQSSIGTITFSGTGHNDMTTVGSFLGSSPHNYKVQIDGTNPDTFKWSIDGGTTWMESQVPITGTTQQLGHDIAITFGTTTGHNLADYWTFSTTVTNQLSCQDAAGSRTLTGNNDGSLVLGRTALPRQINGGPELLSAQDDAANRVAIATWCLIDTTIPKARFLVGIQGNHEWAGPDDTDQNVLLGWLGDGWLALQGVAGGGFKIKQYADSQPRIQWTTPTRRALDLETEPTIWTFQSTALEITSSLCKETWA
jgi:hypothetical protein